MLEEVEEKGHDNFGEEQRSGWKVCNPQLQRLKRPRGDEM